MMSEWFSSLSDGMSEKTVSDKETDGVEGLNRDRIIWVDTLFCVRLKYFLLLSSDYYNGAIMNYL